MKTFEGKFEMVDPTEIVIDRKYQRPEKWPLISAIAANFTWPAFGAITCSRRETKDGEVLRYCLDGQQRLMGALTSNEPPDKVPVISHEVASQAEEAYIFTQMNEMRKAVNQFEKYNSHMAWGDPRWLHITAAANEAGITLGNASGEHQHNTVRALGGLEAIYNLNGQDGVYLALAAVKIAWPEEEGAFDSWMLRALADVIQDHTQASRNGKSQELTVERLAKGLAKTTPGRVMRKGEELRFDMGGSKRQNVRRALKKLAGV